MDDDVFSIFSVGGEREKASGVKRQLFFCRIMVVCVIP